MRVQVPRPEPILQGARMIPVVAHFRVMEIDSDQIRPYNDLQKEYETESEAESDIKQHLEGMDGLMSDTPVLFVVKTFKGLT
jgi:hypothetical protein